MDMKKYVAETMVEAMEKVRADFGDDAIILSSNVVYKKSFLGLFKKKMVEVVAGYDAPKKTYTPEVQAMPDVTFEVNETTRQLKREMEQMKKILEQMNEQSNVAHFPESLRSVLYHLEQQGIHSNIIHEIGDRLLARYKEEAGTFSQAQQVAFVKEQLLTRIQHLPFGGMTFNKKYIHVLGPTGVGKTTTIAKIAARTLLEQKKKVAFITTDTYRIAAIEQLRTYANLLQAPVEVVYNADDFKKAIEQFADIDYVFIDTAGRNYKEVKYVEQIKELVDFSLNMETYLVLSMTSKEADMRAIIDQFRSFPIEKCIFTKMDETNSKGSMYNLMTDYTYGVAYYTNGQEVPEDLEEATADKLIQLMMEGISV